MPHNISFTNGKPEIMFVGETPWHELGTHLDKPPGTAAEAIRAAHLDWRVVKQPIYALDGRDFCVPDDFKGLAVAALAHRLTLVASHDQLGRARIEAERIITELVARVPVPALA